MSNFDKAVEIMGELATEYGQPGGDELFGLDEDAALALKENGLLAPDVQIIRTVEELEALDPTTLLQPNLSNGYQPDVTTAENLLYVVSVWKWKYRLPAVVLATGAQVRAACEAMEEEHG